MSLTKKREELLLELYELFKLHAGNIHLRGQFTEEDAEHVGEAIIDALEISENADEISRYLVTAILIEDVNDIPTPDEYSRLSRSLIRRKEEILTRTRDIYPHWSDKFKTIIMSVVKVIGVQSDLPGKVSIYIFMGILIASFFVAYKALEPLSSLTGITVLIFYFPFIFLSTFFLGRYVTILGKRWPDKEYREFDNQTVSIPFAIAVALYVAFHFGLAKLVVFIIINSY